VAIITYCLVAIVQHDMKLKRSTYEVLVFNIKMDIEMRKDCRMAAVLLGLRSAIYTLSILLFQYCLITFLSSLGMNYALSLCGKGIE